MYSMLFGNNSGGGANALLDGAPFYLELTHTVVPQRGSITPTFTRATTETGQKWDEAGYLDFTALAGEMVFKGARRVRNLLRDTEGFVTGWTKTNTTVTTGVTDPFGGTSAATFTANAASVQPVCVLASALAAGTKVLNSVWLKRRIGTGTIQLLIADGTAYQPVAVTSTWTRFSSSVGTSLGASNDKFAILISTSGDAVDVYAPQLEDVTGQTTQTASEYVSVGVESAPAYHGSMVDGVKCYSTDRSGNPITTTTTYDAVTLNGVAGTYVSTPDTALPGDIDLRCKLNMADWSPSTDVSLISKDNGVSREFEWLLRTDGLLWFYFTNDGSSFAGRVATSSAALTAAPHNFAVNGTYWVRMTYVTSTGKVNFYTSTDGSSWTALGAEQTTTSGTIYAGTSVVEVGSYGNGAAAPLSGSIHRAQIYNGIDGTLAVDFDASRYAGGTTLTGSTGETWTLNGSAVIHPTNYPLVGYVPWEARTNLCLQSEDFSTTWTNNNTTESVNAVVSPNGTTTADKLVEAATNTTHTIYNTVAGTSGVYTTSVYLKAAERTWAYITEGNSVTSTAYFDLTNGVVGTVSGTGSPSARIVDAGNGWYRCSMTFTAGANANIQIGTSTGDLITSFLGDIAKGVYVYGAQLELGSFATPYIPTTTVAVARDDNVLTYTGAGISALAGAPHTIFAEIVPRDITSVMALLIVDDGTTNNRTFLLDGDAGAQGRLFVASGGATQADLEAGTMVNNIPYRMAGAVATNSACFAGAGSVSAEDTSVTLPAGLTTLRIGLNTAGTASANCPVRNVRIWNRALSSSELQAITA